MIDKIQGPPRWGGPDVLLRQTSFRALDERRRFIEPDGAITVDTTRVRFGEVEQRGIALTPLGRERYDALMRKTDLAFAQGASWQDAGRTVWEDPTSPPTRLVCAVWASATSTTAWSPERPACRTGPRPVPDLADPDRRRVLEATPIVYEDFLPRSAAGIFQSNLVGGGARPAPADRNGSAYGIDWLEDVLGRTVHIPEELYAAQSDRSLHAAANSWLLIPTSISLDHRDITSVWRPTMHTETIPADRPAQRHRLGRAHSDRRRFRIDDHRRRIFPESDQR